MKPDFSIAEALERISEDRPILIVDADEVLLQFVAGFERFLENHGYWLDLRSFRLHGNVKQSSNDEIVPNDDVTRLLDEFRSELDDLEEVPGAAAALHRLANDMDIVVLSNVTAEQAHHRRRNLNAIGLNVPIVSNSGLKGPSVLALTERSGGPSFFVDDIPHHLQSAAEHAPSVTRIHLIGDERLRPLLPAHPHSHFRAEDWQDAEAYITEKIRAHRR